MKVLLTGPCGRVGYTTFQRLAEEGYELRAFDTRKDYSAHPEGFNEAVERYFSKKGYSYEWQWGDITQAEDVRQAVADDVDVVIHHAAMALPSQCEEEWERCWEINYYGTLNVIEAIKQSAKKPKLLFSSSIANYGYQRDDNHVFTEDDLLPSVCTYVATKVASELAIRKSGIDFNILRMASATDFRAPHIHMASMPFMQDRIRKENLLKNPASPAHFISVDDVNNAYLKLIKDDKHIGQIFNIAGPDSCRITFKEFQDELGRMLGMDVDVEWGTGKYPQYYYDITKSNQALNYANTELNGLLENFSEAIGDVAEFLELSAA